MTEKQDKPSAVCAECDRETDNYNTYLSPTGELRIVCWQCTSREEKHFNAKRDFRRTSRSGVIPR